MKVTWIETMPLHRIPEMYWGEDLSQLDSPMKGVVIDTNKSFWGTIYLVVACEDGVIREVQASNVKIES